VYASLRKRSNLTMIKVRVTILDLGTADVTRDSVAMLAVETNESLVAGSGSTEAYHVILLHPESFKNDF
jgi:hypothetical protein